MSQISKYLFTIILVIGFTGCQEQSKPIKTRYYQGCNDINYHKNSKNANFMKTMISNNLDIQTKMLKDLGFKIDNPISYNDVCIRIINFNDNSQSFSIINRITFELLLQKNNITIDKYHNRLNEKIR